LIHHGRLAHEDVIKLKALLAHRYAKKAAYQTLLSVFRDVGDGIAFIYLDKWDIKPLCLLKENAGFISGKRGLRLELQIFRDSKRLNLPCIFNDITNSLRYGDITLAGGGLPRIIEVKSGRQRKRDARADRQVERGNRILKYLRDDQGEGVYPGYANITLHRRELFYEEKHHQQEVTNLLADALVSKKSLTRTIEKGLHYHIAVPGDAGIGNRDQLPKGSKMSCWYVTSEEYSNMAYYPFTLSIAHPESLFEFYDGKCLVVVFIDFTVIEEELAKAGATLEVRNDGEGDFLTLNNRDSGLRVNVSRHFIGRLAGEFLSLEWMLRHWVLEIERYSKEPDLLRTAVL
jgi:hypothetical protein